MAVVSPPSPFLLGGEERGGGVNSRHHPDIVQELDIRRMFFILLGKTKKGQRKTLANISLLRLQLSRTNSPKPSF